MSLKLNIKTPCASDDELEQHEMQNDVQCRKVNVFLKKF